MSRLANKVALVTGAASGIGFATAQRFAEEGAVVVLADRNGPLLTEALAKVQEIGRDCVSACFDVTSEQAWKDLATTLVSRFGKLDVLINNAGFGRFQSIANLSYEDWKATVVVNLDSVFLGTKYMMPLLAKSGSGSIVNMSSMRGIVAGPNASAYCAAKGGVRMLTKVTALECAQAGNGVRCNSVHPGHVETPLTAAAYAKPELAKEFLAHTPLARFGKARDIANAFLFLASDESGYMTGSELVVDGGVTCQ
ncbi:short-chain dehydrogenase [Burkholderia sp. FL-7-2-10-S1-D7]|uniref:SDR family NAD(P)-dependent oxidoreductase n=1 Tax=Burkholderia sp. FL-7-2-10-S1-D7 TaxID=1637866 RepID=UPI00075BB48E|nr:SDR family oxidoreductase [Burkholderia sp. FL-7-2-10-S1-D7]KVF79250.1 short-chain dehydrogenase [Burkholderia sp. FL-7-2-10-S1-D7]